MEKTIHISGTSVTVYLGDNGSGRIETAWHDSCPCCGDYNCYRACPDYHAGETDDEIEKRKCLNWGANGIEALILAPACAGIDITTKEYYNGIITALDALDNAVD